MRGPFKLKSGNATPFKQMGASVSHNIVGRAAKAAAKKEYEKNVGAAPDTPLKQDYVKDRYHAKYNPTGTKGKVVKKVTTKAAKKAAKKSFDKWMLGIIKKGGTRTMGTISAYISSMGTAKATQPGTDKHGGKKTGKYNPKTEKYE